jgi:hypothetical protein
MLNLFCAELGYLYVYSDRLLNMPIKEEIGVDYCIGILITCIINPKIKVQAFRACKLNKEIYRH